MTVLQKNQSGRRSDVAEVGLHEFLEAGDEGLAVAFLHGEIVGAVFVAAREGIGRNAVQRRNQGKFHREDQQYCETVVDFVETELRIQGGGADCKPCENREKPHLQDGDELTLQGVLVHAVPELVGEDGADLIGRKLVDEGIVEDDGFGFAEAGEVGVGLGGAAGAVHHLDGAHVVAVLRKKRRELVPKLALLKGRELVKRAA